MPVDGLIYAHLETVSPGREEPLAKRLGELTISWSRFGYRARILTGCSVDEILDRALALGHRACLIQASGHVLYETWRPHHWGVPSLEDLLEDLLALDHLAHGHVTAGRDGATGLSSRCLLVHLEIYQALSRPSFEEPPSGSGFVNAAAAAGFPVAPLPASLLEYMADLDEPGAPAPATYLSEAVVYLPDCRPADLTLTQYRFLVSVARQLRQGRRGFFPMNIEACDDVRHPPEEFRGPLSSLYAVSAGLKPNMILHTHGFEANTRVIYFDYSERALDIRRYLLEEWDGDDYPRFVQHLFRRFPQPETFYQLWAEQTPESVTADDLDRLWAKELEQWGSAAELREHWYRYRQLPHAFVHCNILVEWPMLLEAMQPDDRQAIWWSNAFFTFFSNWHFSLAQRRESYLAWITELATRCPGILLYGADYANNGVNRIQASAYSASLDPAADHFLNPPNLCLHQIRF